MKKTLENRLFQPFSGVFSFTLYLSVDMKCRLLYTYRNGTFYVSKFVMKVLCQYGSEI